MVSQIDAMTMALEIVRVPLQKFKQSLDDIQRALLSARMACARTRSQPTGPCQYQAGPATYRRSRGRAK